MMVEYFNRRWLAESARQGWSRQGTRKAGMGGYC